MNLTDYADQGEQILYCIVPGKEAMVSVWKNMALVSRDHMGEILVYFPSCGVAVPDVHLPGHSMPFISADLGCCARESSL
jgi:hypothetical protein